MDIAAIDGKLVTLVMTPMGAAQPVLRARHATGVVHDHFGLQGLVDHMSVAAGSAHTYVNVAASLLLAVAAVRGRRLLEVGAGARSYYGALMRVRHIVMLLLGQDLSAVRCDRPTRGTRHHHASIPCVREGVIAISLMVEGLLLGNPKTSMDTLADGLLEGAAHLHSRAIVVDKALGVSLAGGSQIVLVVATVSAASLGEHGVLHTLVVCYLFHEVVVLRA